MDKNQCSPEEIVQILEQFEGKIQKNLKQTAYQEREDLAQEIRLKIIEKLINLEFSETLSFWSFIENNGRYQP
ncbi:response regulator [Anoxybacillus sp. B7M1]|jgi:predicted component of type VI protein secretion system|uniref:helix-turn-helix domain-containing protein n=1 Tax=unclassified Anoxybacillus TaxID=2639704 RepID=UPI0005CCDAC5|nr:MULTISPECIES: helix-turn-helix domain-containing protein [unclassified Anoxybacillus]ANB57049.1 response regulator [Anoxybacillus sp. B2M1]ANB62727.1 response regulator [Anoxybacillus sp. B7M1]